MNATVVDRLLERVNAGENLSAAEITELASADILSVGMLADSLRRRLRGTQVTYVRVAACPFDGSFASEVPLTAREVRITGAPPTLDVARSAIQSAKAVAGERVVSGFSWLDVVRLAGTDGTTEDAVAAAFRVSGLDALAELPLDAIGDGNEALGILVHAGFRQIRLTIHEAPAAERTPLLLTAAGLQERFPAIQALNPLPTSVADGRPTTGYEDVRAVALARLAAPNIPTIQVDWLRYGPKLAQVALTFGADDLDNVTASDDAPDGHRRAPLEDVRRNIEAAGFSAVERDGRFALV
jgi:hypothetical protein